MASHGVLFRLEKYQMTWYNIEPNTMIKQQEQLIQKGEKFVLYLILAEQYDVDRFNGNNGSLFIFYNTENIKLLT